MWGVKAAKYARNGFPTRPRTRPERHQESMSKLRSRTFGHVDRHHPEAGGGPEARHLEDRHPKSRTQAFSTRYQAWSSVL